MTTLGLLQYRWRRRWRSGAAQLVLRAVALGLVGACVTFLVGWMGSVFPETLAKNGVQRAPSRVLNAHLMSAFAGLLAVRFVLQRFDGSGWRPFLSLPVSRPSLARAIQLASAVSPLNLFPLVGLGALLYSTVAPTSSTSGGHPAGALATHVVHTLLRTAWSRRAWDVVPVILGEVLRPRDIPDPELGQMFTSFIIGVTHLIELSFLCFSETF